MQAESSDSAAQRAGSPSLDPGVQLQDVRNFENNMRQSVASLRQLRRRYLCVVGLLLASSAYWTWRLRKVLSDSAPRTTQEAHRLWIAWALLGIAPPVIFFAAGMYQSTIVEPSRVVDRLNRALAHYHVAYSAETGRLVRTSAPEPESRVRKPWRVRPSQRSRTSSSNR